MKTKLTFAIAFAISTLSIGCKEQTEPAMPDEPVVEVNLMTDQFPEAQKEIEQTLAAIEQSIRDGDMDKLIAFHGYGPKFTEFINGAPRSGSLENEKTERTTFSNVTEVVKLGMDDLKIAVYGDVANVTFHSDFHLMFGEDLAVVNNQISLLFVKNADGAWKIVHEHHSPLKVEES